MTPGQEQEFRRFVVDRSGALLRTGFYLTGDVHLAHDLLQSALLSVARRWGSIRDPAAAEAYVRRALYRQLLDWRRTWSRHPETPVAAPADRVPVADHAEDTALRHGLVAAIRTLPAKQRAVVVLRYSEDRPEAEVADLLGITVGTVRSQASKALAKLRHNFPDLISSEVAP
jgi:RNA polymerase sigma-70 factor (sigma-E family)